MMNLYNKPHIYFNCGFWWIYYRQHKMGPYNNLSKTLNDCKWMHVNIVPYYKAKVSVPFEAKKNWLTKLFIF